MDYLIDGHNLIGKMPDLDLADYDDEIRLLERLKSWTAVDRKRHVYLFFDGGLPGGNSGRWSSGQVKVFFAPQGRPADLYIIRRIHDVVDAQANTVVTSDREILKAAKERGMPYIRSEDFVRLLQAEAQLRYAPDPEPDPAVDEAPDVSGMGEWLAMFGGEKEVKLSGKPRQPKPKKSSAPETAAVPERNAEQLKAAGQESGAESLLSESEIAAWEALFAQNAPNEAVTASRKEKLEHPLTPAQKRPRIIRDPKSLKQSGEKLSNDEVAEWLSIFNSGKKE